MGLFAVTATAGVQVVNKQSSSKVATVSANISDPPVVQGSVPATTLP
jgi:hypothetical protein